MRAVFFFFEYSREMYKTKTARGVDYKSRVSFNNVFRSGDILTVKQLINAYDLCEIFSKSSWWDEKRNVQIGNEKLNVQN